MSDGRRRRSCRGDHSGKSTTATQSVRPGTHFTVKAHGTSSPGTHGKRQPRLNNGRARSASRGQKAATTQQRPGTVCVPTAKDSHDSTTAAHALRPGNTPYNESALDIHPGSPLIPPTQQANPPAPAAAVLQPVSTPAGAPQQQVGNALAPIHPPGPPPAPLVNLDSCPYTAVHALRPGNTPYNESALDIQPGRRRGPTDETIRVDIKAEEDS